MVTSTSKLRPVQNLGLNDRLIRGVIAIIAMSYPFINMGDNQFIGAEVYLLFVGLYPALTAILGWDPFYTLFNYRTCGAGGRNACGTFPYEVESALGHAPSVDKEHAYDHSMAASRMHEEHEVETLSPKVADRLLVIASLVFVIVVIVMVYWGPQ